MIEQTPAPVAKPRGRGCCITCGVVLIACLIAATIGTWYLARWLETSGTADKMVAESDGTPALLDTPVGMMRSVSEKWSLFTGLEVSPDGRLAVAFAMPRFGMTSVLRNPPPSSLNPVHNQRNAKAWVEKNLSTRIAVFDLATGLERELNPDFGMPAMVTGTPVLSPDNRQVAVALGRSFGDQEGRPGQSDLGLWTIELPTGRATKIANAGTPQDWSPDGTKLAYLLHDSGKSRDQVWIATVGGTPRMVLDMALQWVRWSDDGKSLFGKLSGGGPLGGPAPGSIVQLNLAEGALRKTPITIADGPLPGKLGPESFVWIDGGLDTRTGGRGYTGTSRLAVINAQTGKGVWVGKAFPGDAAFVGSALGGKYAVVTCRQAVWAASLADGKWRLLFAGLKGKEGGASGGLHEARIRRNTHTLLLTTSPDTSDVGRAFLGSGFGETLWRLDIDEAKLAAQPAKDAPEGR
jgi:hypothetical protein